MGAGLSIGEWVERCLEGEEERGASAGSVAECGRCLRRAAKGFEAQGIMDVSLLTAARLRDYVQSCSQEYGPPTIKTIVWSLRKFGDFLVVQQALESNPASDLHHPKLSRRRELPEYLSGKELRQLLTTAAAERPLSDLVILSLLAGTGARPHEIASLRRCDVRAGYTRVDYLAKGGWYKPTPVSAQIAPLLKAHCESLDGEAIHCFYNSRDKPVTVSWIQRMVRMAGEDAGLPMRLTPKLLRHTFATYAADRHGRCIAKALLGHASDQTTDVYVHLSARRFRPAMMRHPYQRAWHRS
jgi:integrase/recombinase XerC